MRGLPLRENVFGMPAFVQLSVVPWTEKEAGSIAPLSTMSPGLTERSSQHVQLLAAWHRRQPGQHAARR